MGLSNIDALAGKAVAALAQFSSSSRLYALTVDGGDELLVEAFSAEDALQEIGHRDVIVVSMSAYFDVETLIGKEASLEISLAKGTRSSFSGEISSMEVLGSDGGLARYRVRISPWMWRLGQVRNCRVWQDKTVIDIIDDVFAAYRPLAKWRWSDEAAPFLADARLRTYCCQYRESDLEFVRRILAEEGIGWRIEQTGDGPVAVLFADSSQLCALPEDASSESDGGVRFHGVSSVEAQDTVQALSAQRRLHASLETVLSYDYKPKRIVAAGAPTRHAVGNNLPVLESFDVPGANTYSNGAEAQHYADLRMQAKEARGQVWCGRSTVRTLGAGTRMTISGAPLQQLGDASGFAILRVTSVGINNMPALAQHALAELFGPIPELLEGEARADATGDYAWAIAQARKTGYANIFEAIDGDITWRPELTASGGRSHAKPTARGAQSAIVIGADGKDTPSGADELYCDVLGRVRVRFHWQDSGDATCWVRVAQRSAGGGMGSQFLPRIGQEVLVQFLENDIDRPIIVGALYNGQGEGGVAPTPGGKRESESDVSRFATANDHSPSAQGNLTGGNSPVWHGASADSGGHRNGAAQWGVRSKEFGGLGYNQLLFDDTDAQGRVQLKSTHAATELNLGHLIHSTDNYRGSFRGLGAELRTDAYGAVRAGMGLLVSSYKADHGASSQDGAGHNAAGISLIKQAVKLAEEFNSAAVTHLTVGLAAHAGAAAANSSALDEKAAPLAAMLTAMSGAVSKESVEKARADAAQKKTGAGGDMLPHSTDPIIAIAASGGLGVNAAQSLQLANGETITLMSGQDTQFFTGGQMRIHTGQAIGILAGSIKPGEGGTGLQLIAAKDAIDIQAQGDELKVQAWDEVTIASANAHIDWAAATSISLSTAGGANITIDGGNITVQCPGKITIHAGKKSFLSPERIHYELPRLPQSEGFKNFIALNYRNPDGEAMEGVGYKIKFAGGEVITGKLDKRGSARHENVPERPISAEYDEREPLPEKPWNPLSELIAKAQAKFGN